MNCRWSNLFHLHQIIPLLFNMALTCHISRPYNILATSWYCTLKLHPEVLKLRIEFIISIGWINWVLVPFLRPGEGNWLIEKIVKKQLNWHIVDMIYFIGPPLKYAISFHLMDRKGCREIYLNLDKKKMDISSLHYI